MLRILKFGHKAVDIDLGEHFLNHPLHDSLIYLSVVDLTFFRSTIKNNCPHILPSWDTLQGPLFGAWTRNWIGAKPSPEWAVHYYYIADEFVRGDDSNPQNPFFFDQVVVNAVGTPSFNPSLPWVFKYNSIKQLLAGDLRVYIKNLRAIGYSLEQAWLLARQIASRLQYLGIQDAPRKRRIDEGPWAGTVYQTTPTKVVLTVTQEKWDKGKN